jgi:hypothetical protein
MEYWIDGLLKMQYSNNPLFHYSKEVFYGS